MLQSLPFDQPLTVVSIKERPSQQFSVTTAPNVAEIRQRLARVNLIDTWPVNGPQREPEKQSEKASSSEIDPLGRLKIAALVAILSQHVLCFVCSNSVACAQQLMNQTEFDFQSALLKQTIYERELANYRKISHVNLVSVFKSILSRLLERFSAANEPRFDQTVLNFVAIADPKSLPTHFTYTDYQLLLAKQYVYSALYDGLLLQFDSTALELYCTRMQNAELQEETAQQTVIMHAEKHASMLEKAIQQIQERTAQIFQRYKLFNQLIEQCGDKEKLQPAFAELKSLASDSSVWNLLKQSPLDYAAPTSVQKASKLCNLAFETRSDEICEKLEQCGFFDDPSVIANLLDQGFLKNVRSNKMRAILLEKVVKLGNIDALLGSENQFKRALWLMSLTVHKLTKKEQFEFKSATAIDDKNAKILLSEIYKSLQSSETPQVFAAHKKKIESFLLGLKQYNLLFV